MQENGITITMRKKSNPTRKYRNVNQLKQVPREIWMIKGMVSVIKYLTLMSKNWG